MSTAAASTLGEVLVLARSETSAWRAEEGIEKLCGKLDGADNKEAFFNSWNLGPSVDAIQEFSIQVGQYSAEFGSGGGAVTGLLALLEWQSLFPGARDYLALAGVLAQPDEEMPPDLIEALYLIAQLGTEDHFSDLLKLALFEKQVNWYTSITEDQASSFIRLFEARYPGVKVNLMREPTFSLVDRIRKEIDAGALQADVLHVVFIGLKEVMIAKQNPPAGILTAKLAKSG